MARESHCKVTLQTLAKQLNTSASTLSRVLNGKGNQFRIAEKTQQRILAHVHKVKYKPNIIARGLRLNLMQEVGLILPALDNPFFTHVAKCVADLARKRNFSIQICVTEDSTDLEIDAIAHMLDRNIAGLVIWPVGVEFDHLQRLADRLPQLVLVDRCCPKLKVPQIALDNAAAAETAINHLLDHGHREIVCFQGLPQSMTNEERLRGVRRALRKRGVSCNANQLFGDGFTQSSGYDAVREMRKQNPSATAILSLSNQITLGALRALMELEIEVPNDISIISFDEIDGVEFFAAPLTTVSQPVSELGRRAATMLFQAIDDVGNQCEKLQRLPGKLICRDSVRPI